MTALLERAIDRVRVLSDDAQDELARVMLRLVGDDDAPYRLTPEEHADLDEAEAEAKRGELASAGDVAAVFERFRD